MKLCGVLRRVSSNSGGLLALYINNPPLPTSKGRFANRPYMHSVWAKRAVYLHDRLGGLRLCGICATTKITNFTRGYVCVRVCVLGLNKHHLDPSHRKRGLFEVFHKALWVRRLRTVWKHSCVSIYDRLLLTYCANNSTLAT